MRKYNLIVIGAGPGGYVAAIEAAKLGQKVAVIEKEKIGGTCLNVGCIPSKAYLKHASWVTELEEANRFGVYNQLTDIDYTKLVERKNGVVSQLQQGIHYLFNQHKIDYIEGEASLKNSHEVIVNDQLFETDNVLLATGSKPFVPPIPGIESVDYLTTDTFFNLNKLPKKLVIIGGGVIGIELAFAMAPLGTEVTVVEVAPSILMTEADLITFPEAYDNKGYLNLIENDNELIEKTEKQLRAKLDKENLPIDVYEKKLMAGLSKINSSKSSMYKLDVKEEVALSQITLMKEEIVNICRVAQDGGKDKFKLPAHKDANNGVSENTMHDDRFYTFIMLAWYLSEKRVEHIRNKRKSQTVDVKNYFSIRAPRSSRM